MVYLQISKGIADGAVFVKDSNSFRSLEDELIDIEYWTKHKKEILAQFNMPMLSTDLTQLLDDIQPKLEKKYREVNRRIQRGENDSFKAKYTKKGELERT